VLLFSTLGMHAFDANVPEADRAGFRRAAEGFFYNEANETRGRLSADHYGTAYVDEPFVRGRGGRELSRSVGRILPPGAQRLPGRVPAAAHRRKLTLLVLRSGSSATELMHNDELTWPGGDVVRRRSADLLLSAPWLP
jgi:hypothetical protein